MKNQPIIERESEILALIDSYIAQGNAVRKPLLIKLNDNWYRVEIIQYLTTKYDKSLLACAGHPLRGYEHFVNENGEKEKVADHPELLNSFLPPAGFDPANPPILFLSRNYGDDSVWNLEYTCDCVARYSIPFVYLAPSRWRGENGAVVSEPELSGFDYVEYYPTIKGWLMDMKSKEDLPNKKRVLNESPYEFIKYGLLDDELIYSIEGQLKARRFELLLDFAESINNKVSFEDLDPRFFGETCEPGICNTLEMLMGFFTDLFIARQFQIIAPEYLLVDFSATGEMNGGRWWMCGHPNINAIAEAFSDFLANTEFAWMFNLDAPVPSEVLQETNRIIDEYKIKYGSVSYYRDAQEAERKQMYETLRKYARSKKE